MVRTRTAKQQWGVVANTGSMQAQLFTLAMGTGITRRHRLVITTYGSVLTVNLVPCPLPVVFHGRGVGEKGISQGCSHHGSVQGKLPRPFQIQAWSVCNGKYRETKLQVYARVNNTGKAEFPGLFQQ